jgi:hypothetical protein
VVGASNPFHIPAISQGFAFTPLSTVDLTQIQVAFFGNSDPAISRFGLELHSADISGNLGTLLESFGGLIGPNDWPTGRRPSGPIPAGLHEDR